MNSYIGSRGGVEGGVSVVKKGDFFCNVFLAECSKKKGEARWLRFYYNICM